MLKHVGRHGDKKVVVLYREVPNEAHMCLVVYSDTLPRIYHDTVMSVLESPVGQQAESLADALFRSMMADGTNSLEILHKNGMIKKINTSQVIMTPTPAASVRLDELNDILNEMKTGEAAVKRLAELDAQKGMGSKTKRKTELQEVGVPPSSRTQSVVVPDTVPGVLTDADLASSRMAQAELMKKNAATMLAEAERLINEATQLDPTTTKNVGTAKTKKAKVKAA
jgi:hypothetical protein